MEEPQPRVICHIEDQLQRNGMTLTQLSEQVGVSLANLSVLKNNRAKAVRFTTLVAL